MKISLPLKLVFLICFAGAAHNTLAFGSADSLTIICGELLSKPEPASININACINKAAEVYYEYGQDTTNYILQTETATTMDSVPFNIKIVNLLPATRYYYRMRYRAVGAGSFSKGSHHSFVTARPSGGTFKFAIEADPHMDTNSVPAVYAQTLQNILGARPDFLIDLGDTFMSEKLPTINPAQILKRHLLLRSYFDSVCHSVPLYLVQGNHDGELGWRLDNTANNLPVWNTNLRKQYYPNPSPDGFYSGNSIQEPFVGLRENYYAWQWGSALFIVLDPYWYTKTKPGWGWTLGADQYNWFKNVISTSTAKFKFVFSHQLVGGYSNDARGGSEYADYFEQGGENLDGSWGFDSARAGWQKPLHTLMVENKPCVFFHGHDHFYGKQDKDGIVYQEVPQPSLKNFTTTSAANYGYVNGVILPNRGYILVTVSDSLAKIEYVRTYLASEETAQRHNGDISHSYTLTPAGSTRVADEYQPVIGSFELCANFPNPFNPSTSIRYVLPSSAEVHLKIYDVVGREIAMLEDGLKSAGTHTYHFDAAAFNLSAGVYFCRLSAGGVSRSIKMIYLK